MFGVLCLLSLGNLINLEEEKIVKISTLQMLLVCHRDGVYIKHMLPDGHATVGRNAYICITCSLKNTIYAILLCQKWSGREICLTRINMSITK